MSTLQQGEYDYVNNLSDELQNIAQRELREDDHSRRQAIEAFGNWVSKQTYIANCPKDVPFLIRFLRARKFSVIEAEECLLHFYSVRQTFPQWFCNLDPVEEPVDILLSKGFCFPLLEKDAVKRTVVFYKFDAADMSVDPNMVFRSMVLTWEILLHSEENQIRGFSVIIDFSNLGAQYATIWPPIIVQNFVKAISKVSLARIKSINMINLHPAIAAIINTALVFFQKKMQNRITVSAKQNLGDLFPIRILPKENGGEVPLAEMTSAWNKERAKHVKCLARLDEAIVDESWRQQRSRDLIGNPMGIEGNFRKLNID